jgi:FixJ family two-component response regulator
MAQPVLSLAVPSEQESARRAAHTIVVVEDDTSMRGAIERVLGAAGFPVRSFATAAELLGDDVVASAACLILDIHLPDQSGLDLRRQLLREGIHPPVIFITAFDGPNARAQAGKLGAVGFLSKPFGGRQLLDAVSNAIRPN